MTRKKLYDLIDSLADDIEFEYKGKHGAICPFSREDIIVAYGEDEQRVSSIEDAMKLPLFNGLSLEDISEQIFVL